MVPLDDQKRKARRDLSRRKAVETLAKTEQLNFRLDAETIQRIYDVASAKRMHVGALVREWVVQRLDGEELITPSRAVPIVRESSVSYSTNSDSAIVAALQALEAGQQKILEELKRQRKNRST